MRPPAVIADDLTGALDTAAQFTGRWGPVAVGYELSELPRSAPCAFSTGTRELDRAGAVSRSLVYAARLPEGTRFKKIDSLLRGNWAAELAAMRASEPGRDCLIAPAFPAQGRITRAGRLIAPGRPEIDIAAMLIAEGLEPGKGGTLRIVDSATDADLEELVAVEAPCDPLWCGAAGLARALAGVAPARPALPTGHTLIIIGSNHPVTIAQRRALAAARPEAVIALRLSDDPGPLAWTGLRVLTFDPCPGMTRGEVAAGIGVALARCLPAMPAPDRLIVTGGETLQATLHALGVRRLRCLGELAPGLPVSCLDDGLWQGTTLVSKSGAFGDEATLLKIGRDSRTESYEMF